MSKIGEQKVIEAYLKDKLITVEDVNQAIRVGYIVGYDQAMKDFIEKACEWLEIKIICYSKREYEELIEQFKNYMQNESEN